MEAYRNVDYLGVDRIVDIVVVEDTVVVAEDTVVAVDGTHPYLDTAVDNNAEMPKAKDPSQNDLKGSCHKNKAMGVDDSQTRLLPLEDPSLALARNSVNRKRTVREEEFRVACWDEIWEWGRMDLAALQWLFLSLSLERPLSMLDQPLHFIDEAK